MAAEFDIIARHFAPIAGEAGLGLLDDAALVRPTSGHDLIITTDALVSGIHFFADDPPESIGHKALAVNLSDLAAKGAQPLGFVLSLMLPDGVKDDWLAGFAKGLGDLAAVASCPLVGGDTIVTRQPLGLSITAFGTLPSGTMVQRGGARPGDVLFVTGSIGDAAIGLRERELQRAGKASQLAPDHAAFLVGRYLRPHPRNVIARPLRDHAHAAMDISDGFAGDLMKMVSLSGFSADVRLNDIPYSVAARAAFRHDPGMQEIALTGGDDYEILCAVPPKKAKLFQMECLKEGLVVTQVGVVNATGNPVRFFNQDGTQRQFSCPSYFHKTA
jgi:thiamine-monophosphate kinase